MNNVVLRILFDHNDSFNGAPLLGHFAQNDTSTGLSEKLQATICKDDDLTCRSEVVKLRCCQGTYSTGSVPKFSQSPYKLPAHRPESCQLRQGFSADSMLKFLCWDLHQPTQHS